MEKRIGFIGIIIADRKASSAGVQEILSQQGDCILGRMGLPSLDAGLSVITLIVEATTDQVGALTGKLGRIPGVTVKSGMAQKG